VVLLRGSVRVAVIVVVMIVIVIVRVVVVHACHSYFNGSSQCS
jgi:hypothetical protein